MVHDPTAALLRWVEALNQPHEAGARVEAAFAPAGAVERYGVWEQAGQLVERFEGHAAITAWLGRSPEGIRFWLDSPVEARGAAGEQEVRYAYGFGEWMHGGAWRFRLAEDGRLAWLAHLPDVLDDRIDAIDWTPVIEEACRKILGDRE